MKDLVFKNGKAQIKNGRNVIATIYDRVVFFANTNVNWNKKFPYSLQMNGSQAECEALNEAIDLFYKSL